MQNLVLKARRRPSVVTSASSATTAAFRRRFSAVSDGIIRRAERTAVGSRICQRFDERINAILSPTHFNCFGENVKRSETPRGPTTPPLQATPSAPRTSTSHRFSAAPFSFPLASDVEKTTFLSSPHVAVDLCKPTFVSSRHPLEHLAGLPLTLRCSATQRLSESSRATWLPRHLRDRQLALVTAQALKSESYGSYLSNPCVLPNLPQPQWYSGLDSRRLARRETTFLSRGNVRTHPDLTCLHAVFPPSKHGGLAGAEEEEDSFQQHRPARKNGDEEEALLDAVRSLCCGADCPPLRTSESLKNWFGLVVCKVLASEFFDHFTQDFPIGAQMCLRYASESFSDLDSNALQSCCEAALHEKLAKCVDSLKSRGYKLTFRIYRVKSCKLRKLTATVGGQRGEPLGDRECAEFLGQQYVLDRSRAANNEDRTQVVRDCIERGCLAVFEAALRVSQEFRVEDCEGKLLRGERAEKDTTHIIRLETKMRPKSANISFSPTNDPHSQHFGMRDIDLDCSDWLLVDFNNFMGGNYPFKTSKVS